MYSLSPKPTRSTPSIVLADGAASGFAFARDDHFSRGCDSGWYGEANGLMH